MVTHPFYSHPTEDELYRHYEDIGQSVGLPLVLYNNPGTTGVDASPELLGRISQIPNIDYVKESSGDASRLTRIMEASEGRLNVFSGTDHLALDHFAAGAGGWVSASANVLAAQCVALYRLAAEEGDLDAAPALYREIHPFLTYSEVSGHGIQAIKGAMAFVGRPAGEPRPPLRALSAQALAAVRPLVDRALGAPLPVPAGRG